MAHAPVPPALMRWHDLEEKYLRSMYDSAMELSREYMKLYTKMYAVQTKLRLPAIFLSTCSGVASFGSNGFTNEFQRWISIGVGIINVGIAIIQSYESYLKIGDIVSKSLTTSTALKKLADDIHCETFIPVEDRDSNGVTFLRDCFSRYQMILEQAPPLEMGKFDKGLMGGAKQLRDKISNDLRRYDDEERLSNAHRRQSTLSSDGWRYSKPQGEVSIEIAPSPPPSPMLGPSSNVSPQ